MMPVPIFFITWGAFYNWWWFLPIGVLVGLVWYIYLFRNKQAALLDKSKKLLRHFSAKKNIIKAVLASCALVCLFLALLHPQWGKITDQVEQQGRDLMIALDISRSMLAQDVGPDRLTCAKQVIVRIAQALETDRVSLMIFSEKAKIYCPLTKDIDLVKLFLDQIDYTTLNAGTTRLDQPITCALEQCKRNPDRKHNILLLVSDGEDFSGALAGIKEQAAACGLTILVVGVGTPSGAPIPIYNEQKQRIGYLKNTHDQVVISQLNKSALNSLAKNTGGMALFVEKNSADVGELVGRIKQFEKERQGAANITSLKEQYSWFLLVGFVCLLLEWIL